MDAAALDRVYEAFQDFHDYCAPVFGRKQWRERSGQYLQALLESWPETTILPKSLFS